MATVTLPVNPLYGLVATLAKLFDPEAFGERVKAARVSRTHKSGEAWSQAYLANRIGVAKNTLGLIERGRPPRDIEIVVRLAFALGVTESFLITGKQSEEAVVTAEEEGWLLIFEGKLAQDGATAEQRKAAISLVRSTLSVGFYRTVNPNASLTSAMEWMGAHISSSVKRLRESRIDEIERHINEELDREAAAPAGRLKASNVENVAKRRLPRKRSR